MDVTSGNRRELVQLKINDILMFSTNNCLKKKWLLMVKNFYLPLGVLIHKLAYLSIKGEFLSVLI